MAQNGSRIIRALLEIAISKKWADVTAMLMTFCKSVERRMWSFDHPLKQFDNRLQQNVLHNFEYWADGYSILDLVDKSAFEIGRLIHMNEKHGAALLKVAREFPAVNIHYMLQPLTSNYLRVVVRVEANFDWGDRPANASEPFWLWLEDNSGLNIYQQYHLFFYKQSKSIEVEFAVPVIIEEKLPRVTIRFASDAWLGSDKMLEIPLSGLLMPAASNSHTSPLRLPIISLSPLRIPCLRDTPIKSISELNSIQTQVFWPLINTNVNFLLCAPAGSGKSTLGWMVAL